MHDICIKAIHIGLDEQIYIKIHALIGIYANLQSGYLRLWYTITREMIVIVN